MVEATGLTSEAVEHVERAQGHLCSYHQLTGHADLTFGKAATALTEAGHRLQSDVVGRNVIDGRWTFQVVDAPAQFSSAWVPIGA